VAAGTRGPASRSRAAAARPAARQRRPGQHRPSGQHEPWLHRHGPVSSFGKKSVFVVVAGAGVFCPSGVVEPAFEIVPGPERLTIVPGWVRRASAGRRAWLPGQPERRVLVGDEGERIGGHPAAPAEDSLDEGEHAAGVGTGEHDGEPRHDHDHQSLNESSSSRVLKPCDWKSLWAE